MRPQHGFSLIEVLIGFLLVGILSIGVSSLMTSQNKEMNAISEKFAIREINSNLSQSFAASNYCNCLLAGATLKTDGVAPDPKYALNLRGHGQLPYYFSPTCAEVGGLFFPASGSMLPGQSQMKTANPNYTLSNFTILNPAPGAEDEFVADLILLLDRNTLVRELRPPKQTLRLKINTSTGTPDSRPITSCNGIGSPPATSGGGSLLAVHSQTSTIPDCPVGFVSLWSGYSYAGMSGGPANHGGFSDLASVGSCLEEFRPMSAIECQNTNDCDFFTPDDFSVWLTATDVDQSPASGIINTRPWISRCRACRSATYSNLFARHSQTTTKPVCPSGATELWEGYSFAGGTIGHSGRVVADLSSPGSCMKEFYLIPFVECGGASSLQCDYYTTGDVAYYLSSNINSSDEGVTSGNANIKPKISRCVVCGF